MKREWRDVLTQILILKAAVLIVGIIVYFHRASQPANTGLLFARFWYQWDALRYLAIAENGYISSGPMKENIVFYPLFPLLIKTAGFVVRDVHLGGFLLAQILSVAGFLMFYGLARHEQGHQNALMSLWSLMLFPTAFFFHLPYTEGLFVLCAAGCFLASRTKRWMWAGIAGFFAVTTRITGMCLLPALMVEFYMQYRRREVSLKESAWLLLLPLGVMIFLGINHVVSGNAFSFMKYQAIIWHRHLAFPWVGLWGKIQVVGFVE
jgi:Gpi18-like mannosyltransferase